MLHVEARGWWGRAVLATLLACSGAAGATATADHQRNDLPRHQLPPILNESLAGIDSFDRYCAACHGTKARGDGPVAPQLKTRPPDLTQLARRNGGSFPAAPGGTGGAPSAALRRPPAENLTQFTARNGGVFPSERVARIIDGREVASHGDREMPVWGFAFRSTRDGLSQEQVAARIAAIVAYLEAIQRRNG